MVVRLVLNNSVKVLLLEGRHYLKAMRQLHVGGDVDWISKHILVCSVVRADRGDRRGKKIRAEKACEYNDRDCTRGLLVWSYHENNAELCSLGRERVQ